MSPHVEDLAPSHPTWISAARLAELHHAVTVEYEGAFDAGDGTITSDDLAGVVDLIYHLYKLSEHEKQVVISLVASFVEGHYPQGFD